MYILAPNEVIEKYPYSIGELRKDNPQVSFPKNPGDAVLAESGVYPVAPVERPVYDPRTEKLSEGTPVLVTGTWTQTWVVTPMTAEEMAVATAQAAEQEAQVERQQANEEFEPAKLAPALKVLAEKLLSADIAAETLPEKDAQAVTLLFPKWEGNGVAYAPPRVLQFGGHLYEVMLAHTSQPDWAPDVATTLFRRRYAPTGGIPLWQVWDGHNDSLYQVGSEVMHNGLHWISTIPNNSWVPGEYGWDQVA